MSKEKRTTKTITIGSGNLYISEYDIATFPKKDEEFIEFYKTIETSDNEIGKIQGGASLDYAPEFYTASDDNGTTKKVILQSEEVTLKSGIMTWNTITLKKLSSTGRVSELTDQGIRLIKIGGINNQVNKDYVVHFVHKDPIDGDVRITIVGKNTSGFSLAFAKDKETVIDAEFKSVPMDNEGTLVILSEVTGITDTNLIISSSAGTTTGKTKLTVSPNITASNSYKYKTGSDIIAPAIGDNCSTGYTSWDGIAEVTATTGNKIVIAEVDSSNTVVKIGTATVTAKA